ncbi:MAG TPA: hypothetical protein VHD83_13405 [Puia sp.]|nr:hypothetical protein [Puia sp.]
MSRNKKREKKKSCYLGVWTTKEEAQRIKELAARSTCGSFSEFGRRLLLGRQATVLYRNESLDKFLDEAILLRNEMALLRASVPWTAENERRMIALLESIQSIILKIYEQCEHI